MDQHIVERLESLIEQHGVLQEWKSGETHTAGIFPVEWADQGGIKEYDFYHDNNPEEFQHVVVSRLPDRVEFVSYDHNEYTVTYRVK